MRLITPRKNHSSIVYDKKLYIVGGINEFNQRISSVEIYNPILNIFESTPSMVYERSYFNLIIVCGELYAVGGRMTLSIEKMNKFTGHWTIVLDLPSYRCHCATTSIDSKIYLLGGYGEYENQFTWESFDIFTKVLASEYIPKEYRRLSRSCVSASALSIKPDVAKWTNALNIYFECTK